MSSPSTIHGIPIPEGTDDNDSVAVVAAVITALESGSIVRRLSQAQIDALTGPQKPSGLVVFNSTTQTPQVSNGSTFRDVPLIPTGGGYTAWTPTLTQGVTVTASAMSRYIKVGGHVHAYFAATLSSNGTAGQQVTLTLPTAAYSGNTGLGSFVIPATGAVGAAVIDTVNTVRLLVSGAWYTTQLTSGQQIIVDIRYEAA